MSVHGCAVYMIGQLVAVYEWAVLAVDVKMCHARTRRLP